LFIGLLEASIPQPPTC